MKKKNFSDCELEMLLNAFYLAHCPLVQRVGGHVRCCQRARSETRTVVEIKKKKKWSDVKMCVERRLVALKKSVAKTGDGTGETSFVFFVCKRQKLCMLQCIPAASCWWCTGDWLSPHSCGFGVTGGNFKCYSQRESAPGPHRRRSNFSTPLVLSRQRHWPLSTPTALSTTDRVNAWASLYLRSLSVCGLVSG